MPRDTPQQPVTRRAIGSGHLDVWLAAQREPESDRYNITVDLEFSPGVDVAALRAAFGDLLALHPGLRSRFHPEGGTVEWQILAEPPFAFVTEHHPGAYDRDQARRWAATVGRAPFDPAEAPLVRAALLVADDAALLAITMHHLISDGWSTTVLAEDLVSRYRARLAGQPGPARVDEHPAPGEADLDAAEKHWAALLAQVPEALAPIEELLPGDELPGPSGTVEHRLPAAIDGAARRLAREQRCSTTLVWLSAWSILLRAWAGGDGSFGMVFSGRGEGDEETVDLRSRVLPVRARGDGTFTEVLSDLRDQMLDALEHSHIGLDRLRGLRREGTGVERSVFMHTPAYEAQWTVGDTTVRRFDHPEETTKYPFSINVLESDDATVLCVYYDSARYTRDTARVFAGQLGELVARAAAEPRASAAALLSACDPGLAEVAVTENPAGEDSLIPELVLRHAEQRPDAVAVRHGDRTMTYGELAASARSVANWLRARGLAPGDTIALLLAPGAEVPVYWLGAALAGVVYVPLDPAYPVAQLQLIVDDARPSVLVVSPDAGHTLDLPDGTVITAADLLAEAADAPETDVATLEGASTFCVLYTSGTTGRPKGVVLPHRGLARLMRRDDFIPLDHTDVVAQLCPLNFDGASYEIWGALAHGGQIVVLDKHLVLSPRDMRDVVRERGITTLLVTTPLLNRIIEDAPDLLQSLRRVYFGGELISVPHMRKALRWCRPGVLLHSYGPTENSFTSTWYPITEIASGVRTLPIGTPVPGTRVRVLMEGGAPAPRGVPGELLLGGVGLADGYLGDPHQTAARFVADPDGSGRLLYRTGDRVRWTPSGQLEFIGRDDNQVKIRSQRVELGEVEAVLGAHPHVETVFVTVRRNRRDEKEIIAYLVTAADTAAIRRHAQSRLPAFAVPSHIVAMAALPMTPTGKIDRRNLPEPVDDEPPPVPAVATAPRPGSGESGPFANVRTAWREVLEHNGFDDDQNFFDAGGHSLLIVRLQERLRVATGVTASIVDLMRHSTVRAQAGLLGDGPATAAPAPALVPHRRDVTTVARRATDRADERRHHILAVSALTDEAVHVTRRRLARHLDTHRPALDDVAHTLDIGREHWGHRAALVADDLDTAVAMLADENGPALLSGRAEGAVPPAVVFAFTDLDAGAAGQQASRLFPLVRRRVDEAAALLGAEAWPNPAPGIGVAVQVGLAEQLIEWNISPAAIRGDGFGRAAAAILAGSLSFADGVTATGHTPIPETAAKPPDDHVVLGIGTSTPGDTAIAVLTPGIADDRALLTAVARLWCLGVPVRLSAAGRGRRVRLPVHPLSWATARI